MILAGLDAAAIGCGPSGRRFFRQNLLDQHPQAHELLVLLDEHGQEHDLEGQEVRSIGGGGQMAAGSGQEIIEGDLVFAAQGAPEADERLLLGQEGLGDGGKRAAHRNLSEQ
jgi:hypothetical protein